MNLIDAPGLEEVKPIGEDAREDGIILDTIKHCLNNEITKIHTLLVFTSFITGITEQDIKSIKSLFDRFYNENIQIAFVITRSENQNEESRKVLEKELSQLATFQDYLKKPNVSILYMGCAPRSDLKNLTRNQAKDKYARIAEMRETLLQKIFKAEEPVSILKLPINAEHKMKVMGLLNEQIGILDKLEHSSDPVLGENHIIAVKFQENMKKLTGYVSFQNADGELSQMFITMKSKIKAIIPKYESIQSIKNCLTSGMVL
jgi:hypothetical protein